MFQLNSYIDLHTHSTSSDGTASPAEIIDQARELGLTAVALTDHDTVSGIKEFLDRASHFDDIHAVPGVEVSTRFYGQESHIVGLFVNPNSPPLNKLLRVIREDRTARNLEMIAKLQQCGYEITLEEVSEFSSGDCLGRPHFAKALMSKGYFDEPQKVFDKCLRKGTPGYCLRRLPRPEQAIQAIHDAGGLAFWAHVVFRQNNERSFIKKILKVLLKCGIDGLETYYSTYSPRQHQLACEFAEKHQLLQSGGSDFHGSNQPSISLGAGGGGLRVPEALYFRLVEHLNKSASSS